MKNSLEGLKSIFEQPKEKKSVNLKIRPLKLLSLRNRKKRDWRKDQSPRDLWNTINWANIYIVGVPEGEEQKKKEQRDSSEK